MLGGGKMLERFVGSKIGKRRIETGRSYGYPDCCINFMVFVGVKNYSNSELKRYKASPFRETGFIQCPECLKKHPDDLLLEIARKRDKKHKPFPKDTYGCFSEYFERYMQNKLYLLGVEINSEGRDP